MKTTVVIHRAANTYNDGQPYRLALGRRAPQEQIADRCQTIHPVVQGKPSHREFLRAIIREMKIRFYSPKTIKSYSNALRAFLRWFGHLPHKVTREDVRNYLELLVDGGGGSSWVSINLSALRTAFDKMCGRQITLGLVTPRRAKRHPVVLSQDEVLRMIGAAISLRDKLLITLMYATGVRVSEVARLRWRDFDFDQRLVNIRQGKGRSDRQVTMPTTFQTLLARLSEQNQPDDFVFPSEAGPRSRRTGESQRADRRYLSPRTIQRVVTTTAQIAGVRKHVTPHALRHAFATHLLESGTDIRFIQKLLGHARLETTTIYTKVAVIRGQQIASPLDAIVKQQTDTRKRIAREPVGRMKIELTPISSGRAHAAMIIQQANQPVVLTGMLVHEPRPGWVSLEIPPHEDWQDELRRLNSQQRQRIESPEFYELLRQEVTKRFMALRQRR